MMVSAYCAGREDEVLAAARRCVAGVGASYPGHDLIVPGAEWLVGRPGDVPDLLPPLPDPDEATPIDQLWAGSVVSTIEACRGELDRACAAHARGRGRSGCRHAPVPAKCRRGRGCIRRGCRRRRRYCEDATCTLRRRPRPGEPRRRPRSAAHVRRSVRPLSRAPRTVGRRSARPGARTKACDRPRAASPSSKASPSRKATRL